MAGMHSIVPGNWLKLQTRRVYCKTLSYQPTIGHLVWRRLYIVGIPTQLQYHMKRFAPTDGRNHHHLPEDVHAWPALLTWVSGGWLTINAETVTKRSLPHVNRSCSPLFSSWFSWCWCLCQWFLMKTIVTIREEISDAFYLKCLLKLGCDCICGNGDKSPMTRQVMVTFNRYPWQMHDPNWQLMELWPSWITLIIIRIHIYFCLLYFLFCKNISIILRL